MSLEIVTVPCQRDNFAYLLRDAVSGEVGVVDVPVAGPINDALDARGWTLNAILITHHHDDHVAGVDELRTLYGAKVTGAVADRHRLPPLDHAVSPGDSVSIGTEAGKVIDVPGHTVGHVAFHFPQSQALFSADSLMALGCGRLFEGTPEQMWASLSRLAALPDETRIYAGHDYIDANARFSRSVDPDNPARDDRLAELAARKARGDVCVSADLATERATNPFLRAVDPGMKRRLGMDDASDAEVFAEIRRRKDAF